MRKLLGFLVAAASLLAAAVAAPGAAHARSAADGTFKGTYTCGAGIAGATVTITSDGQGRLRAFLRFYDLAQNPGIASGAYRLTGRYVATSGELTLIPRNWVVQPPGYTKTGIRGTLSRDRQTISGRLTGDASCTTINLRRLS